MRLWKRTSLTVLQVWLISSCTNLLKEPWILHHLSNKINFNTFFPTPYKFRCHREATCSRFWDKSTALWQIISRNVCGGNIVLDGQWSHRRWQDKIHNGIWHSGMKMFLHFFLFWKTISQLTISHLLAFNYYQNAQIQLFWKEFWNHYNALKISKTPKK